MSITSDTSSTDESFARASVAGDFPRMRGWPREAEPDVFVRLAAKLALMADPSPEPTVGEYMLIATKDWSLAEEIERDREAKAPTIDHKPVVTLFDPYGNGRVVHVPLAQEERWDPETVADEKKRARWRKWIGTAAAARSAGSITAMMKFASKVIDGELKEMKQPRKKGGKGCTIPDHVKAKIERPVKQCQRVKERLEKFSQDGKKIRADRTYLPFEETFRDGNGVGTALRSHLGIRGLELFNARLPKKATVGYDKRGVFVGSEIMEPVFVRDMEYITIGWWTVRGQIIVDLDGTWPTLEALRADLARVLGPKLMPTLIDYRLDKAGHVENPHLFWILPPGSEVGICGNSKPGPVRTFDLVQQAVISALIELGADTGHENKGKCKNPLSPKWSVACTENFPDLQDFIANLPTLSTNKKEMRRRKAARDNVPEEELTESQREFKVSKDIFKEERARGRKGNDREFKGSLATPDLHAKWLRKHAAPRVIQALGDTSAVRKLLQKQIAYWAGKRPSKRTRQYEGDNRGRDHQAQEAEGLVGAEAATARKTQGDQRKKTAGTITRANQGAESRAIVREQLKLFASIGGDLDDDESVASFIIRSGKLGKSTVYKWLPDVLASFRDASRYIARTDTFIPSEAPRGPCLRGRLPQPDPVVSVASAATSPGKPGQSHSPPLPSIAEPLSSEQACSSTWLHSSVVGVSCSSPIACRTPTIPPSSSWPDRYASKSSDSRACGAPTRSSPASGPTPPLTLAGSRDSVRTWPDTFRERER